MNDEERKPNTGNDEDTQASEEEICGPAPESAEAAAPPEAENIEELRAKARERDQFLEMLQRTTADFLNYQKRMRKERETLRYTALRDFVEALLPGLDNLDHAIAAAKDSPDSALLTGVRLAQQEILRILSNFGIERIPAVGQKFDPNFHEAIVVENSELPEQTVIEELRPGYTLDGKTLRAAQVKVSGKPGST